VKVNVLFFGATADITGNRRVEVEIAHGSTALAVSESIIARYPRLAFHNLHISLNQQYAIGHELLSDGDEIAVFTAVSGG
jgi:molybdopterin converting factor small subunit